MTADLLVWNDDFGNSGSARRHDSIDLVALRKMTRTRVPPFRLRGVVLVQFCNFSLLQSIVYYLCFCTLDTLDCH